MTNDFDFSTLFIKTSETCIQSVNTLKNLGCYILRRLHSRKISLVAMLALVICLTLVSVRSFGQTIMTSAPQLLTDPFLHLPTETSVQVVWFTEFAGVNHTVTYSENLKQTAKAITD